MGCVGERLPGDLKRLGTGVDPLDRRAELPGQPDAVLACSAADIQDGRVRGKVEPRCEVIEHVGPGWVQALIHRLLELFLDLAIRVLVVNYERVLCHSASRYLFPR